GRDPQHLVLADLRPRALRRAARHQDRRTWPVAGGAHRARG
ncbi:MAG: Excisionase/Xis, DNA-binding, partial [uncultured Frankineae bacterium]